MKNQNKGEWSELYVLLKLIEHPMLYLANDDLEINYDAKIPVFKIIHYEDSVITPVEYTPLVDNGDTITRKDLSGLRSILIDRNSLKKHVSELFNQIANAPKNSRSFTIPHSSDYMAEVGCIAIKAGSLKKADIILDIIDRGQERKDVGYSIKSMIGGASTLFNASQHSGIKYKVTSYSESVEIINALIGNKKYQKRVKTIIEKGGKINFDSMSPIFAKNLSYIDTNFPEMLAAMVKNYYLGKGAAMQDVVQRYAAENQMDESLVEYKVKQFLLNAALGMTPGKLWDGYIKAEGGYLVVKDTGELACYQAYSRDKFADYLYKNTKIDTPSGGRHKFGNLALKEDGLEITLNFQIRFNN